MARILVVDDELSLLKLLQIYLTRAGHHVVCFATATEAIGHLDQDETPFDIAVLDHWLPDMSGIDLLNGVLYRRPSTLILLASGSLVDVESLHLAHPERVTFLRKPYLPRMLVEAINTLLQR